MLPRETENECSCPLFLPLPQHMGLMALCLHGPGDRLSGVCPARACLLQLEGTAQARRWLAQTLVLTGSIPCPASARQGLP